MYLGTYINTTPHGTLESTHHIEYIRVHPKVNSKSIFHQNRTGSTTYLLHRNISETRTILGPSTPIVRDESQASSKYQAAAHSKGE